MESRLSTEDLSFKFNPTFRARRYGFPQAKRDWLARWRSTAFVRGRFKILAALADAIAIMVSATLTGVIYHGWFYHVGGVAPTFATLGAVVAVLFVFLNHSRKEYEIVTYLTFSGHGRRTLFVWNMTFLAALIFFLASKHTSEYSRGSILLIYLFGLVTVISVRAVIVSKIKASAAVGKVSAVRAVLVGSEEELRAFTADYMPWTVGIDVIASAVLRGPDTLSEDLALAAASARVLRPDDIYILVPWSESDAIDACLGAFMKVPAAIHLGPQRVLDRFMKARVSRIGTISSLHLVSHPLTMKDLVIKRVFDFMVAAVTLIVLSPLMLLLAALIKLDSPGPVFFIQRRYGFNQHTFRIVKFRSMTVAEDGRVIRQATSNDPRVTRIGRILRRYNLDELPQLFNVLIGEMSLVGPRPHALAHNQFYDRSIADYARRHNVKPGITGWAQIHGLRGETKTDDAMRARIEYDLYYIDNWSLSLDLRIIGKTLLSAKAFENAC